MKDTGEVIPVKIKSLERETYFMLKESLDKLLKLSVIFHHPNGNMDIFLFPSSGMIN